MSFSTGQFASVLKMAEVIPIQKKQSRVIYQYPFYLIVKTLLNTSVKTHVQKPI